MLRKGNFTSFIINKVNYFFTKQWMKCYFFIMMIVFLGIMQGTSAQDVRILSRHSHGIQIKLSLPFFSIQDCCVKNEIYQKIIVMDWANTTQAGFPQLPIKGILVQVPVNGKVQIAIEEDTFKSLAKCNILPVSHLTETGTEFIKNQEIYHSTNFFPPTIAEIGTRSIWRGIHVMQLKIYPFRWNPKTGELRYSTDIRLRITYDAPFIEGEKQSDEEVFYENLQKNIVLNYQKNSRIIRTKNSYNCLPTYNQQQFIKMEIATDGIYRITHQKLIELGMDPKNINPDSFRLFCLEQEIPIKIGPDYIEFYGENRKNLFTATNVYCLTWGGTIYGKRIQQLDGSVTGQSTIINAGNDIVYKEENHELWEKTPGDIDTDRWFWKRITAPENVQHALNIPKPHYLTSEALLQVCFRGRSLSFPNPNHHTRIYLNQQLISDNYWHGDTEHIQKVNIASDLLMNGFNQIRIEVPGDTGAAIDVIYLNWLSLDYKRCWEAIDNELFIKTLAQSRRLQAEISKISNNNVLIYDVSDPSQVKEIINVTMTPEAKMFKALFEYDATVPKTHYLTTIDRLKEPKNIVLWNSPNLKSTENGADYIVITSKQFLTAVEPLCELRRNQSLRVKSVAIEDIYNEFNWGIFDPKAVKNFLKYAYENWQAPVPSYVLLVGDANVDYHNYLGTTKQNIVPPYLSLTSGIGITPDDNTYVCVQGDDELPEMFLGRLPGKNYEAVVALINKIIQFENMPDYPLSNVLFASDNNEIEFENLNNSLATYLPPNFTANKVYLRSYSNVDSATQSIISHINSGTMLINYVGHGSYKTWAGEKMFEVTDIPLLSNWQKLPLVLTFTCLNGHFANPYYYCLAEEFVLAPDRGSIACFSPSGNGYMSDHSILAKKFFANLFNGENRELGYLTTRAKMDAYSSGASEEILRTFTLLGDPASKLKIWK